MNTLFDPRIKKVGVAFMVVAIVLGAIFLARSGSIERLDIISSNPSPFIRHFAPAWRSLKRIVDLPYVFLSATRNSELPVYEITLSKKDKEVLFDNLPDYPRVAAMWEEYKKTVKGEFRADRYYVSDAKIRNRGVSPPHWNARKKSWQVNLPNEQPLGERTTLRLFIPEERGWIFGAMNAMRARELGIISPAVSYVRLYINKADMGIYLLVEGWEESMLENNGRPLGPLFSNLNLDIRDVDLLRPDSLFMWENRLAKETPSESTDVLAYFLDLIANAPDDVFAREIPHIVDMDIFYRWLIITSLSGNFHQGNGANQNWYFNPATAKLEPMLFDSALTQIENDTISLANNRLVNRTMRIPTFNKEFTALLRTYLSNTAHKERVLAYYDETFNTVRNDIVSDTKKIQTSAAVLHRIEEERDIILRNYDILSRMLAQYNEIHFAYADEQYPLTDTPFDTSKYEQTFLSWSKPIAEFLRMYPQFQLQGNNTLVLPEKIHAFNKTVIVPAGYTLVIKPGARLLFGKDISLFSYSRVESIGTALQPITIQALDQKKPWGVFAVLEAPETSIFRHVRMADGKDALFNGLYFSGALSLRASDIDMSHSTIVRSLADDGIHIFRAKARISNSTFDNVYMDGIDIDFAADDSLVEKNMFRGGGGDAIDLSFSDTAVRENTITGCGDKGISVGEFSNPLLEKNTIIGCAYGIAVKDRSNATIHDSILLANDTGIGLYRKKPHFIEGGYASAENVVLWDNTTDITEDTYSNIAVMNSVVESGFEGLGNSQKIPSFEHILSADLSSFLKKIIKKP